MYEVPLSLDYWYYSDAWELQLSVVSARFCVVANSSSMPLRVFS